MAVVARWLEAGRPIDGRVWTTLDALGDALADDGDDPLALLSALSELEESGVVSVAWAAGRRGTLELTLTAGIRRDAARLFGD